MTRSGNSAPRGHIAGRGNLAGARDTERIGLREARNRLHELVDKLRTGELKKVILTFHRFEVAEITAASDDLPEKP